MLLLRCFSVNAWISGQMYVHIFLQNYIPSVTYLPKLWNEQACNCVVCTSYSSLMTVLSDQIKSSVMRFSPQIFQSVTLLKPIKPNINVFVFILKPRPQFHFPEHFRSKPDLCPPDPLVPLIEGMLHSQRYDRRTMQKSLVPCDNMIWHWTTLRRVLKLTGGDQVQNIAYKDSTSTWDAAFLSSQNCSISLTKQHTEILRK